jgi:hypothetical protein
MRGDEEEGRERWNEGGSVAARLDCCATGTGDRDVP